jgi:putative hemolysin
MIQNVFEFDDLTVDEFATHRTDISLLWLEESVEEWAKTIHETRHSLYPICDETVDHVIGILNAKDYFRLEPKTKENILENAVKPAYFVPETVCADVLFRQMKKTRNHFAVVLDEYGGMVGIVTMSDLLEQLVGDLETEDIELNQEQDIERIDSSTWKIRGSATLDKVAKELSISLPVEDYDTFSGFIFGSYGSIPEDGTTFELDSHTLHIQVLSIADHKIEKTIVCMEPAPTDKEE